jgi:hypothetical protein
MTIFDPAVHRAVFAKDRLGENDEVVWWDALHVKVLQTLGMIDLAITASGGAAPTDTTKLWFEAHVTNAGLGVLKAHNGTTWVALTPGALFTHLRIKAGYNPGGSFPGPAYNTGLVTMPSGGRYADNNAVTGAIRIKLPKRRSDTSIGLSIRMLEWDGETAGDIDDIRLEITGVNAGGGGWSGAQARVVAGTPAAAYFVAFGEDASNSIIWLFKTSAANFAGGWSAPTITITEVALGLYNATAADWSTGFVMDLVTAYGGGETQAVTIQAIATGSSATNLAVANLTATTLDVTSDTGADATLPAATTTQAGLLTAADKTKLDGALAASTLFGTGIGSLRLAVDNGNAVTLPRGHVFTTDGSGNYTYLGTPLSLGQASVQLTAILAFIGEGGFGYTICVRTG